MKKYKQVEPGMLQRGDVVYMKVTIEDLWGNAVDVKVEDNMGTKDWNFQIPLTSLLVEDNDGKKH